MRIYPTIIALLLGATQAMSQDCGSYQGVGLPCWRDFLGGEGDASLPYYPYAKRENGCSIPGGPPGEFDRFSVNGFVFSFRSACNAHDRCYYTYGTLAGNCNASFSADLADACLSPVVIPIIGTGSFGGASAACGVRAGVVWTSVTGTQDIYHTAAQTTQLRYLMKVNSFMGVRAVPAVIDYLSK